MKKIIFGLLLLVGGALFLINHLAEITSDATDKVSNKALSQLIATGNKPEQNQPTTNAQVAEDKSISEQVVTPLMKPLMDDIRKITDKRSLSNAEQIESSTKNNTTTKPPIATIKIYDKKTNKEIIIETQTTLEARQQAITTQQKEEQQQKDARFRAYYQKSEKCLSPTDNETRVTCGNEYIRAKAKFEELYQQGKFKN